MKILANSLRSEAKNQLEEAGFNLIDTNVANNQLENFIIENQIDVVVFEQIDDFNAELIDNCDSLKLIAFEENITYHSDIEYAKEQGIQVIDTDNASTNAKAELVFAHLFSMVRFLHQSNREMPLEGDHNFNQLKRSFTGIELKEKTLGIIGMDNTGIEIAKKAIGLGMKIKMTDHNPKNVLIPLDFFDGQSVEFYVESTDFKEVLSSCDFIVVNTYSDSSYIIDSKEFEQMQSTIGIINLFQGAINEVALLQALEQKNISFAGLDAFEKQPKPEIQLLMHADISLSPNIATKTYETEKRTSDELANKIIEALQFNN